MNYHLPRRWQVPLVLFFIFYGFSVSAQTTIKGTIISVDDGLPLPGVSVTVKGTSGGTVSDINGKYQLTLPADATYLVVSYLGFKTQEVFINGQSNIIISLRADSKSLDEIVVIGYGSTSKKKLVGAVSSLDTKKLEQTPFMNVGQALQGQVPGLIVNGSGGGPGNNPSISIRGGKTPLYVIDGVITGSEDFEAINSDDIESISFLKDASATAVYGSRAGDGIVLITTKKGKAGKTNINYSLNYQLSQPTTLPEMMSSYQYALVQNAANVYDGTPITYTDAQLEIIRNHSNLDLYPDNNFPDLTLKNFAPEQRHNLSLNGGNEKTSYFVSLGSINQGGILKEDVVNYSRLNLRSNVNTKFEKIGLDVGINVNSSIENYEEPSAGMYSIWRSINQNTSPFYRAYNLDGTLAGGGDGDNPLAITSEDAGYNRTRDKFINAQLVASWQVPKVNGLKVGAMANYRDGDGWRKVFNYNVPLYLQDGSLAIQPAPALNLASYYNKRIYLESSLSYGRTFGNHGIDATVVYNQTTSFEANLAASRRDFLSGAVDELFAGSANGKDNDGSEREAANAGYVFRLKYDYDARYIIEFSGRYDGNDNFSPKKRWGFFPAISLGWNITDESFMETLKSRNIVNDLKLRASYGETGITEGVNRFGYIPVYNLESSTYNIGNTLVNGYSEGALVNPNELTWYNRNSLNFGLDFVLLKDKLSGTAEYFYYRTTGYLQSPNNVYSQPLGKPLPQIKSNSAQRRAGLEFSLNYNGKFNKLSYQIGVNYAYYNQLWEQLDTEDEATLKNPYTRITHRTDYWGVGPVYLTNGLYQASNDILNAPRLLSSTETQRGDIRYQDINGDGKIDAQDKRIVGLPATPHANYGVTFGLGFKGWALNGLFQGTGDRFVGFDNFMIADAKRRTYVYQLNYWTPDNPNALYPRVSSSENVNGGNNNNVSNPSDFYLKNAKYFRLKSLQFSYDLKKTLLKDLQWLPTFKAFVNGTNLFTVSDVMEYFDPEQAITANTSTQTYGYPVQRTYSFGLNVGF